MPYITSDKRAKLAVPLDRLFVKLDDLEWNDGAVNYIIYKICITWFKQSRSYSTIKSIRGTLAGVLSEFDRKFGFPYEDEKEKENGDIP